MIAAYQAPPDDPDLAAAWAQGALDRQRRAAIAHAAGERAASAVAEDMRHIHERFESADRALHRARTAGGDAARAEVARRDAMAEQQAAADMLADLGLLLVRYALSYRGPEFKLLLRDAVAELMRPELEAMAQAIARMERRR